MTTNKDESAIALATRHWLEKVVIGLNLCPFAKYPYQSKQVRIRVSQACSSEALTSDLADELLFLDKADPAECETTLLVHPGTLGNFDDYNEFLDVADGVLETLGLEGILQIASFHPDYCFEGAEQEDAANFTNRSPFPMLHLLREASIERAVASIEAPEQIYQRNIETLRKLGRQGWLKLMP
ncbi:MAG: DUF1415 domain-containing protein [Wenzhouxiangella sp.]